MKPQDFAKVLAGVAIVTALAGVASAATMVKGTMTKPATMPTSTTTTMTKGTMTSPAPAPVMKPMM